MQLAHRPRQFHRKPRYPTETPETPLFGRIKPLPRARLAVGGWLTGDLCLYRDPRMPGTAVRAVVVAALVRFHEVVIRVEGRNGHITLNPILHPALLGRRTEATK